MNIYTGVMKRCLKGWIKGSHNFRTKLKADEINSISNWLIECNKYFPSEATRKIRPLNTLSHWKAIEYRTFLLYLGPVILKGILPADAYEHFLHFSVATSIFVCDKYVQNATIRTVGDKLLSIYVENFKELYGEDSISHNVHNLIHVILDVEQFGALHNISAYPFESTLYRIKCLLKSKLIRYYNK